MKITIQFFFVIFSISYKLAFAQGGMVAVPSFGDPPKKQAPAPTASPPPPPPSQQTAKPPPPPSAPQAAPAVPPPPPPVQVTRPILTPPPSQQLPPPPSAQQLPPPSTQPLPPPPTAQPLPPPPTAQPLPPPPAAQQLPPPPLAQPLPQTTISKVCTLDEIRGVIYKSFEPRIHSDGRGWRPVPNPADAIQLDGPTIKRGLEICNQSGLTALRDGLKVEYKRIIVDGRGAWFEPINQGPLRNEFAKLIASERLLAFNKKMEEEKINSELARLREEQERQAKLEIERLRKLEESCSYYNILVGLEAFYFDLHLKMRVHYDKIHIGGAAIAHLKTYHDLKGGSGKESLRMICRSFGSSDEYIKAVKNEIGDWDEVQRKGQAFEKRYGGKLMKQISNAIQEDKDARLSELMKKRIQAVYFIDGTRSSIQQRNIFHQMARWAEPINEYTGKKGYVRILSGISTFNAEGIDELYALATFQIFEDIENLGVNEIYIFGFSRGAILTLNLVKDLCKEGGSQAIWTWSPNENKRIQESIYKFDKACARIKAVVLVDPVNTFLPYWSTVGGNTLKANTINIYKENASELYLSNANISNIEHKRAIPDLDHSGMMCGKVFAKPPGTSHESNLVLLRSQIVDFVGSRGLKIKADSRIADCFDFDGAWPPCLVTDGRISQCTRNIKKTNWDLNSW